MLIVFKEAEKVKEASDAVLLWPERTANTSNAILEKRAGYGQGHYDKYAGKPADSKSQKGAYKILDNAKKCADQNPSYKVFDADGKVVYEPEAVGLR